MDSYTKKNLKHQRPFAIFIEKPANFAALGAWREFPPNISSLQVGLSLGRANSQGGAEMCPIFQHFLNTFRLLSISALY